MSSGPKRMPHAPGGPAKAPSEPAPQQGSDLFLGDLARLGHPDGHDGPQAGYHDEPSALRAAQPEAIEPECFAGAQAGLESLSSALVPVAPDAALRARLLAAVPQTQRFARFAEAAAALLDIDRAAACELLDRLGERSRFVEALPGVELLWVDGGPGVANALRGFVRVAAGGHFPEHEHLGEEHLLVLQGSLRDESRGRILRPGDLDVMPAGSTHGFVVPAGGPDLLGLSVVHAGLRIAGQDFLPQGSSNQR